MRVLQREEAVAEYRARLVGSARRSCTLRKGLDGPARVEERKGECGGRPGQ
jgi:hypothetical protein